MNTNTLQKESRIIDLVLWERRIKNDESDKTPKLKSSHLKIINSYCFISFKVIHPESIFIYVFFFCFSHNIYQITDNSRSTKHCQNSGVFIDMQHKIIFQLWRHKCIYIYCFCSIHITTLALEF